MSQRPVLGAVIGDIIGAPYEHHRVERRDFPLFSERSRFTDDTVLTVAVANAIVAARRDGSATPNYHTSILAYARRFPRAGYGRSFREWIASSNPRPYGSWANGAAMRVSPVGWAFDTPDEVLLQAAQSAAVTHDHPDGITGAQAVALAVYRARTGASKDAIRSEIAERFGYALDRSVEEIRPVYRFDVSAAGSVPEAIIAFLDSHDFESAVRNAVWLGGDADTQASIAGAIAEAFYGDVARPLADEASTRIPADFIDVLSALSQVSSAPRDDSAR